jgi:benzoate/toluate 1,2-dioxygenase beta subunit
MKVLAAAEGVRRVRALYESLRRDVAFLAEASPADPMLSGMIATALAGEARLLDSRAFDRWLRLWDDDATYWVPLAPGGDPEHDQALFLDDHRRLQERVGRMYDTTAWALHPQGETVRVIGNVEAWPLEGTNEVIASSTIAIQHTRMQALFATSGRQIHRLRRVDGLWRLSRKILLLPAQEGGTPHLGWLL